jgi:hypothetical protein
MKGGLDHVLTRDFAALSVADYLEQELDALLEKYEEWATPGDQPERGTRGCILARHMT